MAADPDPFDPATEALAAFGKQVTAGGRHKMGNLASR